jgi:3-oxoacyl-[acyl-carrier-protein] synthase II
VTGLAVSAWSAISPFGIGAAPFAAAVRAPYPAVAPLDGTGWDVPQRDAALVQGFDARTALGTRGTRSMDRATALAVATVGHLLAERADVAERDSPVALVLGTSNGSVQSMMDFTRDSLTQAKPFHVDPARFPNTVMNCAAGQCAIWHGLRGPNTTVAGGRAAGLLALSYAHRLWRRGHAGAVLCGAVEEFSEQRARLEWRAGDGAAGRPLGEGCAVLLLEPAAGVELLGLRFGVHGPAAGPGEVLTRCARRLLAAHGVDRDGVWKAATNDATERPAIEAALGGTPDWVSTADWLGDAGAASAAFQVAALLALAHEDGRARGRHALVAGVDRDGVVGCALFRFPNRSREE